MLNYNNFQVPLQLQQSNLQQSLPKLDLSRAKKIQETQLKKQAIQIKASESILGIQQQQQVKCGDGLNAGTRNFVSQENILQHTACRETELKLRELTKQLEEDLQRSRIMVQEEILKNRANCIHLEDLKRQLTDLEARNDLLINANSRYEDRWQKMYHSLLFYRDFFVSESANLRRVPLDGDAYSKAQKRGAVMAVLRSSLLAAPDQLFANKVSDEHDINDPYFSPESLVRFIRKREENSPYLRGRQQPLQFLEAPDQLFDVVSQGAPLREEGRNIPEHVTNAQIATQLLDFARSLHKNRAIYNQIGQRKIKNRFKRSNSVTVQRVQGQTHLLPLRCLKREMPHTLRVFTTKTMRQKNSDSQLHYRFSHSEIPQNNSKFVLNAPLQTESDDVALGSPEGIPQILKQFDARAHLLQISPRWNYLYCDGN